MGKKRAKPDSGSKKRWEKLSGRLNHYRTLQQDGDLMLILAKKYANQYEQTGFSRAAIIHYVLSLEALINRTMDFFWPSTIPKVLKEDVEKWSTAKKWERIPLLFGKPGFNTCSRPFQYLAPLFELRNEYVHAKEHTYQSNLDVFRVEGSNSLRLGASPNSPKYAQMGIYRNPTQWRPADAERIKGITEELVEELDRLFDGALTKDNWLNTERLMDSRGNVLTVERGQYVGRKPGDPLPP